MAQTTNYADKYYRGLKLFESGQMPSADAHCAPLIDGLSLPPGNGEQVICLGLRGYGAKDYRRRVSTGQDFHFLRNARVVRQRQLCRFEVLGTPVTFDEHVLYQALAAQGLEFAMDAGR